MLIIFIVVVIFRGHFCPRGKVGTRLTLMWSTNPWDKARPQHWELCALLFSIRADISRTIAVQSKLKVRIYLYQKLLATHSDDVQNLKILFSKRMTRQIFFLITCQDFLKENWVQMYGWVLGRNLTPVVTFWICTFHFINSLYIFS